jgi:hypothetical protein
MRYQSINSMKELLINKIRQETQRTGMDLETTQGTFYITA